jgi:3D (Asp-Asp-Asp) domain-containing protein
VIADGREQLVERPGSTVAETLKSAGIAVREADLVTPTLTATVRGGETIRIVRVEVREVTVEEKVPPTTKVQPPTTGRGPYHPTVTTSGKAGLAKRTYRVVLKDGKEASKTLVQEQVLRAPVPEVVTARPTYGLASRGVYGGRRVFEMEATAYDPGPGSCPGTSDNVTCNGKRAGYGIVAVDPKVIPLGSKLYIEGYGYGIAADVGGAIKGNRIDLGYNSREGALKWGRKTVRVFIID